MSNTIRTKSRQIKNIILVGGHSPKANYIMEWYDHITNQWHSGPEIKTAYHTQASSLAVLPDGRMFVLGGYNRSESISSVCMLNLLSKTPCWVPTFEMLSARADPGVAVLNNCIYAVCLKEYFYFKN